MNHISTLRLHQFRLGELAPDASAAVQTHLVDCDTCASRLGHQRDLRLAFHREPVPAALLPAPAWTHRLRTWWLAAALVPALGATALVASAGAPVPDGVYPKGVHNALEAWVQTGGTARPVYTGERVRAGTRVQLKFDPGSHRFVTLAGRDATGVVEVYGTVPAQGPGLADAPFALTLDNVAGDQAFYAVLTDTRPDPTWVTSVVRKTPVSTQEVEVASVVLHKE